MLLLSSGMNRRRPVALDLVAAFALVLWSGGCVGQPRRFQEPEVVVITREVPDTERAMGWSGQWGRI